MAKTKAQETESKGKAVDGEDPTEARLSKLEEMFTEQNKKLEKMFLLMNNSMAQKVSDEQSSLEQVIQKSSQEKENRSGDSGFSRENKGVDQGQERGDNHRAYKAITRMGKIDFPRFDGTMFKTWLFKAEQFFGIDHTPEDLKVKMAAIHFDDEACNWHKSFIEDGEEFEMLYDWKGYVELLRERFE